MQPNAPALSWEDRLLASVTMIDRLIAEGSTDSDRIRLNANYITKNASQVADATEYLAAVERANTYLG